MITRPTDEPSVLVLCSWRTLDAARELAERLRHDAYVSLGAWDMESELEPRVEAFASRISDADSVIALLGDDDARAGVGPPSNLMFEIGMAFGLVGPDRVMLAGPASIDLPFAHATQRWYFASVREPSGIDGLATMLAARVAQLGPRPGRTKRAVSAYVSYTRTDLEFVRRLASDLGEVGISCWLDETELEAGSHWRTTMLNSLGSSDRLIVVLSQDALNSDWVLKEATIAAWRDTLTDATIMFPLALDDSLRAIDTRWTPIIKDRQVLDFNDWQDPSSYARSLRRLIQGVTSSAAHSAR